MRITQIVASPPIISKGMRKNWEIWEIGASPNPCYHQYDGIISDHLILPAGLDQGQLERYCTGHKPDTHT